MQSYKSFIISLLAIWSWRVRVLNFWLVNLNEVVLGLKTIHAKDDQKPQLHQKSLSKFIILLVKIQIWLSVKLLMLWVSQTNEDGELNMKKLFEKWEPHTLTIQQKLDRKQISQHNLEHFKQNKTDFLRRFITMDETWIYHHDPKLKQERLR